MLNAICKKLAATLSRPDLEMAAPDYFERLGNDNHRRPRVWLGGSGMLRGPPDDR
jgi:hypothetical protein